MNEHEQKVQAGEVEKVKASEEVVKRNVISMMQHGNETRKMLREMLMRVDAIQNKQMQLEKQQDQFRIQLASVQQKLFAGSTK